MCTAARWLPDERFIHLAVVCSCVCVSTLLSFSLLFCIASKLNCTSIKKIIHSVTWMVILLHTCAQCAHSYIRTRIHTFDISASCVTRMPTLNSRRLLLSFFLSNGFLGGASNWEFYVGAAGKRWTGEKKFFGFLFVNRFYSPFTHIILDHLTNVRKIELNEDEEKAETECETEKVARNDSVVSSRLIYFYYIMCEETVWMSLFLSLVFRENKLALCSYSFVFLPHVYRVASMPNTGVEEEYYRLRHFSITGKGVVNRGDSLKSRRSRSNNSVASSNSR